MVSRISSHYRLQRGQYVRECNRLHVIGEELFFFPCAPLTASWQSFRAGSLSGSSRSSTEIVASDELLYLGMSAWWGGAANFCVTEPLLAELISFARVQRSPGSKMR